ncbi:uncharacterized protein LOC128207428 [Mya arenaria]|uniref:uncharacterized protein LOC128207428 n=1 Tax=Mya arenaria TaxID=6604 RepID=UPI0022E090E4|nr:uncharacterized protein LOC128207428 [Mya arenaria]XP_052766294.1 uncharacterized protein LOC128207428 [Mya arenaria]
MLFHDGAYMEGRENDSDDERRSEDEANGEADDRDGRFVESQEHPEFMQSREIKNLKPYYSGSTLDDRNAEMRKSIYYIRQNWDEYSTFTELLKNLFLNYGGHFEFEDKATKDDFENLMCKKRTWLCEDDLLEKREVTYEAVRLYTSDEGYRRIYRLCNHVFRDENCLVSVEEIRAVVFLIELISIDLYNYCMVHPASRNFRGTVWRGLVLGEEDFSLFRTLRSAPLQDRNIAVPLVLFSASSKLRIARKFIKHRMKEAEKQGKQLHPIVYKINIIGLKSDFITHFKKRFPRLTLTTIGAVDIHEISRHPGEREVLLRGPYTLILDVFEDAGDLVGRPCSVLEALVITSNRDHITTSVPGPEDDLARKMYGAMVTVTRAEYCVEYYRKKGLAKDEEEYESILSEGQKTLDYLWDISVEQFSK